ncbi:hypothetical protein EBT25_00680 [bacterium]|jgi:hypothetical protein|nr:hypothetical protein [bacterium]
MTQDQIIQTLHKVVAENQNFTTWTVSTPHLVALVNHAIEAEREACAEIAEKQRYAMNISLTSHPAQNGTAVGIANQIRARGQA